jgi:mannose-6-phosphate isomerase-like protein (cupin superfamily)
MKRAHLRFGEGFKVAISNDRAQVATMTLAAGDTEGDADNRHGGADQWLFVVGGTGTARINGKRYPLRPGSLLLIERGDRHEIIAGRGRLETLNVYVPPAYTSKGDERPAAKPR